MRLARKERRYVTPAYGPAVVDRERACDTLTTAERALRGGDARLAEETYQRVLGKLGPFADPMWSTDEATDARTRAQCHARLAALAFDDGDYDRSLRQTAVAAAARHHAIEVGQCTGDDVRFLITAMVHSATVHERKGAHREAMEASAVALEFARFSRTQTYDVDTRRSIAAAQRAAACLYEELRGRTAGEEPASDDADGEPRVRVSAGADWLDTMLRSGDAVIDLNDHTARRDLLATASIDVLRLPDEPARPSRLRPDPNGVEESFADLVPEIIDLTDEPEVIDLTDEPEVIDLTDEPEVIDHRDDPDDGSVEESAFDPVRRDDHHPDVVARSDTFATLGSLEPEPNAPRRSAQPVDLLDEVAIACTRHPATGHPLARPSAPAVAALVESALLDPEVMAAALAEPELLDDEGVDARFERPDRRGQQMAAMTAETTTVSDDSPAGPESAESAESARPAGLARPASAPILIPADRRQDQSGQGESAAGLVGRSRGQSLLARVLLGHSDSEAALNAHRAVRTATRARQWAKEDPDALPSVALNLIEALVVRGDVLVGTGHDEVARTDLRRARAIAEQLWQACPTPTNAVAAVLVAFRSADLDDEPDHEETALEHLALARAVIDQANALDIDLPQILRQAEGRLADPSAPPESAEGNGEADLRELGDRLLDHLQARGQDPAELEPLAPTIAAS